MKQQDLSSWAEEEYYVYPSSRDWPLHTDEHPFCDDGTCPCHEDEDNQQTLQGWYDEGLIGATDGDLIYRGRTI